jgi:UDP-N-acetylglucosamine:LPS N-acetylglucosamine transferase
LPLVGELFGDEERLATMRKAMQSLNRPQAAQSIAALLRGLASGNEVGLHG